MSHRLGSYLKHRLTGMTAARDKRRGSEEPVALLDRNASNFSFTSHDDKPTGDDAPSASAPASAAGGGGLIKTLSWHHLVGVTFFAVCGGDYGIEDSIGAGGVGFTLIGLCVLPWVWSLPIALMTAELSSMIPETGGYVVWAHRAFGSFWATQNAVWNLVRRKLNRDQNGGNETYNKTRMGRAALGPRTSPQDETHVKVGRVEPGAQAREQNCKQNARVRTKRTTHGRTKRTRGRTKTHVNGGRVEPGASAREQKSTRKAEPAKHTEPK
jgi:hypothetical protein